MRDKLQERLEVLKKDTKRLDGYTAFSNYEAGEINATIAQMKDEIEFLEKILEADNETPNSNTDG